MEVTMIRKIFAVAMALSLISTAAFAQKAGPRGGDPKCAKYDSTGCSIIQGYGMFGRIDIEALRHQLKLTDEQVNKINALHLNHRKEMLKYREVLAPKQIKIQRLLLEDAVNFEEVKALIMDIAKTQGEMLVQKLKYRLGVEQVLTPEQRVNFKSMRKPRGQVKIGDKKKMGDRIKKTRK